MRKYLTHLNILGEEGEYTDFEEWYQEVRFALGENAPQTLEEASELRYKDVLEAARVFNQLQPQSTPAEQVKEGSYLQL